MTTIRTGAELKAWRLARGWSQEAAGLWYGLPTSSAGRTWRRWESGERRIPGPLRWRIQASGDPTMRRAG